MQAAGWSAHCSMLHHPSSPANAHGSPQPLRTAHLARTRVPHCPLPCLLSTPRAADAHSCPPAAPNPRTCAARAPRRRSPRLFSTTRAIEKERSSGKSRAAARCLAATSGRGGGEAEGLRDERCGGLLGRQGGSKPGLPCLQKLQACVSSTVPQPKANTGCNPSSNSGKCSQPGTHGPLHSPACQRAKSASSAESSLARLECSCTPETACTAAAGGGGAWCAAAADEGRASRLAGLRYGVAGPGAALAGAAAVSRSLRRRSSVSMVRARGRGAWAGAAEGGARRACWWGSFWQARGGVENLAGMLMLLGKRRSPHNAPDERVWNPCKATAGSKHSRQRISKHRRFDQSAAAPAGAPAATRRRRRPIRAGAAPIYLCRADSPLAGL